MPDHNLIDLTGKTMGRWTVLRKGASKFYKRPSGTMGQRPRWVCVCSCGKRGLIDGSLLRRGTSKSCGCYRDDISRARMVTHGQSKGRVSGNKFFGTPVYEMFRGAKERSKKYGVPFDLCIEDIAIPEVCPVFGFPLVASSGRGFPASNSPSLDRIVPSLGYVKGNICVISYRANVLKRDASIEDLEAVIEYMRSMKKCSSA